MGGEKAGALLSGRPLLAWSVAALRAAGLDDVAVVAKAATALPVVGAERWDEPDEPRHPLAGVRHALERAGGRDVVTLPVDLPLVPGAVLARLAAADLAGTPAAVVRAGGRVQPLVARFTPACAGALTAAGRVTDAVLALGPLVLDVPGEGFQNVNGPAELAAAEALLSGRAGGPG